MSSSPAGPRPAEDRAHVLVVANETVGGNKLMEAIEDRAKRGRIRCTVVCPQNKPRKGYVIYDQNVRSAARIRLELTLERLRELGIPVQGEVMDPDPFLAVSDAVREYGPVDEIIISSLPYPRSGWLRRGLIERVESEFGLPVQHVVVDLKTEPIKHTLVVANETVGGRKLIDELERRATESPHRFTVISPQGGKTAYAAHTAEDRLERSIDELRQAGLHVMGHVVDGDPLTSIENAFQFDPADEIIISTFPARRSRWLGGGDLINAVRRSTGRPVEHIEVEPEEEKQSAPAAAGAR